MKLINNINADIINAVAAAPSPAHGSPDSNPL
jgi:hypothetical protein